MLVSNYNNVRHQTSNHLNQIIKTICQDFATVEIDSNWLFARRGTSSSCHVRPSPSIVSISSIWMLSQVWLASKILAAIERNHFILFQAIEISMNLLSWNSDRSVWWLWAPDRILPIKSISPVAAAWTIWHRCQTFPQWSHPLSGRPTGMTRNAKNNQLRYGWGNGRWDMDTYIGQWIWSDHWNHNRWIVS